MKKIFLLLSTVICLTVHAQTVSAGLQKSWDRFMTDSQLKSAMASLYVVDAATGKAVFARNEGTGMATASTLKVITAATAFELLGKDFRYETRFFVAGTTQYAENKKDSINFLVVKPSGDPTLGSWRWKETGEERVMQRITEAARSKGVRHIQDLRLDTAGWQSESIPDGWTWQDIGNYYGAGANPVNWRENQYDLILRSHGKQLGAYADYVKTKPYLHGISLISFVRVAPKGTGDRSYIYFSTDRQTNIGKPVHVRGTIPAGEEHFTISGSFPNPWLQFYSTLWDSLHQKGLRPASINVYMPAAQMKHEGLPHQLFHTEYSPVMDSIIYWFLRRSINLYGEALVRTIAGKTGPSATDAGVAAIKAFWKTKGIDPVELNIYDGSGLSPLNRVSTRAQVQVLQYARQQPWFASFYHALPVYNHMKIKSGTINDVKGFCGYHTAANGKTYIFSFLVNNYNGPSGTLVEKMYKVLDVLK